MKAKNIKSVLKRVYEDWLDHIDDPAVKDAVAERSFVTGGAIASMLLGEKVHDYDVYMMDFSAAKLVANYYVRKFKANPPPRFANGKAEPIHVQTDDDRVKIVVKSAGVAGEESAEVDYRYFEGSPDPDGDDACEYIDQALGAAKPEDPDAPKRGKKRERYRPRWLSSNAITLSDKMQICIRFYGDPAEIHTNYDFVHCTSYWTPKDNKLVLPPAAIEALLAKELRYVGSKYPLASFIRTRKFIQRGWMITAGQYLKIAMNLNALDLTDIAVLEDQLCGMDAAYFEEIIRLLKQHAPDAKQVDAAYLVQLIDRLF